MIISTYWDIPKGLTRETAMRFRCPKCGAEAKRPCTGRRIPTNERVSPHIQRYDVAARRITGERE